MQLIWWIDYCSSMTTDQNQDLLRHCCYQLIQKLVSLTWDPRQTWSSLVAVDESYGDLGIAQAETQLLLITTLNNWILLVSISIMSTATAVNLQAPIRTIQ